MPNALCFVPHEDDELSIIGPVIKQIQSVYNLVFVFMTNGEYEVETNVRIKESLDCLHLYKVPLENIIFLGYPDQFSIEDTHFFIDSDQYCSKHNKQFTEGTKYSNEYRFLKTGKHAKLTSIDIIKDIEDIILEYRPELIIGVDYDSHPDHRTLSMALEEAIGNVLLSDPLYYPKLLKQYAYGTMYEGREDFSVLNLPTTKYIDSICDDRLSNPFQEWEKRLSLPVAHNKFLGDNLIFKACTKYPSQIAVAKSIRMINSDHVFWLRRTDNILRNATSDNPDFIKLIDFKIFTSTALMKQTRLSSENIQIDDFLVLYPGEKIELILNKETDIEYIDVYYMNKDFQKKEVQFEMILDGFYCTAIGNKEIEVLCIPINSQMVKIIKLHNIGVIPLMISEMGVYEQKPYEIESISLCANDSMDQVIYFHENTINFEIRCIEKYGRKNRLQNDEISYSVGSETDSVRIGNDTITVSDNVSEFSLHVWLFDHEDISYKVDFKRMNRRIEFSAMLLSLFNDIFLRFSILRSRIIRKICLIQFSLKLKNNLKEFGRSTD